MSGNDGRTLSSLLVSTARKDDFAGDDAGLLEQGEDAGDGICEFSDAPCPSPCKGGSELNDPDR